MADAGKNASGSILWGTGTNEQYKKLEKIGEGTYGYAALR